ncbi:MAG: GNAT family N-acetyltransferase [Solirubrobacteraceae bacterium]
MAAIEIRSAEPGDREEIARLLRELWGSEVTISRGRAHDASRLPALLAVVNGRTAGLATFAIEGDRCELVTLDALTRGHGIGTALLDAVAREARDHGCSRLESRFTTSWSWSSRSPPADAPAGCEWVRERQAN